MARDRDDYEDDDRPARRSSGGGGSGELGPLDKMYRDTNVVILVLFGICCGIIAFVLSLVCFLTAKDPTAKSNAKLVMIVGIIMFVIGIALNVLGVLGGLAGGGR